MVGQSVPASPNSRRRSSGNSLAARTMGFDVNRLAWSEELLALAGLEPERLSELQPSGTVIGQVPRKAVEDLGLTPGAVAVTAGMSGRDCVTFSSVDPDRCVLCVCREFSTLSGGVVSEQEIVLRCATPGLPELLACTAALALGFDIAGRDIV